MVRASAVSPFVPKSGRDPLARNIVITGIVLGLVGLGSARMALFGSDSFGAPERYVESRSALKIALAEPVAPQFKSRDPRAPIDVPETRTTVAMRSAPEIAAPTVKREPSRAVAKSASTPARRDPRLTANPPLPGPIPLPLARLKAANDDTPQESLPLSYAADPGITGSLGNSAPRPVKVVSFVPDKPAPLARPVLAKPSRLRTPHEKLYGPVRVASLNPGITMREAGTLPTAPYDLQTAVYVISDRKVYMPDGTSLEAHSGLGDRMDDPRFVHMRMRGATPPHVYDLAMRERLFHGVEAIRLNPVGGEDAIFGRDGLLAHTYLLGGNGQSNGCVSFKDYSAFLSAFKAGKITRLAVLAKLD